MNKPQGPVSSKISIKIETTAETQRSSANSGIRPVLPAPELKNWFNLSPGVRKVLSILLGAEEPQTVTMLARKLDLHANTVREHLEILIEEGMVEVETRAAEGRGRPWLLYSAVVISPLDILHEYMTLLHAIGTVLDQGNSESIAQAYQIGLSWAQSYDGPLPEFADSATESDIVRAVMSRMGFSPSHDGTTMQLHSCPLLDDSGKIPPFICIIHHGFLEGILARYQCKPPASAIEESTLELKFAPQSSGCRIEVP